MDRNIAYQFTAGTQGFDRAVDSIERNSSKQSKAPTISFRFSKKWNTGRGFSNARTSVLLNVSAFSAITWPH